MSALHHTTRLTGPAPARVGAPAAPKKRLLGNELLVRVLFGSLLAAAAILVTFAGGYFFAGFVALAALAAAREWHRLMGTARYGGEWAATGAAITIALVVAVAPLPFYWPFGILLIGGLLATAIGFVRGAHAFWSGLGSLYIGVPSWSLVALREHAPAAPWVVLGIFLTIWTADTGALAIGRIFGGPKLIPSLSPNKTWSGLAGGLILPALVLSVYVSMFGGSAWRAFAVGALLAVAGHSGDLFESWLKRRVGRKDSGDLIPGHGGVLDRLDSTLFVAPLAASLVFLFGLMRLVGVHS